MKRIATLVLCGLALTLDIAPFFFLTWVVDSFGKAQAPKVPVPLDKRLAGLEVFVQGGYLYPTANAAGLLMMFAMVATLGTGESPDAATLRRTNNNPRQAYGSGFLNRAPVVRISY